MSNKYNKIRADFEYLQSEIENFFITNKNKYHTERIQYNLNCIKKILNSKVSIIDNTTEFAKLYDFVLELLPKRNLRLAKNLLRYSMHKMLVNNLYLIDYYMENLIADTQCKNASRIYYSLKKVNEYKQINDNEVLNLLELINEYITIWVNENNSNGTNYKLLASLKRL